ncbi:MAG TPA: tRNA dihydrouridine synthase DusB [Deltaproteobacteria bacterium]|nr:tRNA dihydrouridine synthase DusB [Deltaproteobacteria bacterium]HIJ39827.1 tRNA dihydrouridine synthase DusB [Deltaproteobacteria bacterium]
MTKTLQIGTLKLENRYIMAPMSGISNLPFRLIARKMGAGLVTSEMTSAAGLSRKQEKTLHYLKSDDREKPLAVQIFGADPGEMAAAAEIAVEWGADLVDINMGCPARKVLKTGSGGALLRSPHRIGELVQQVRKACSVPLTAKIRSGYSPENDFAADIAKAIEDNGADGITVHPRFVSQGFSGKAQWQIISLIKRNVTIPVIGNGDVFKPEQAMEMIHETGCDGVMLARGAIGNPWLFRQILELEKGCTPSTPSFEERRSVMLEHFGLLCENMGELRASRVMRGLLLWYTKGLPRSSRFRGAFTGIRDLNTMISAMDEYFNELDNEHSSTL